MDNIEHVRIRILPGGRLDRRNAALALNRAPRTLADWSRLGIGPKGYHVGGRVFYDLADIQSFAAGKGVK